jgi:hypothetical protein
MHAHTHADWWHRRRFSAVQLTHVVQNRQRCPHGSDRIILVRYWKAETDEQPIADVTNNGPIKSSNGVGARVAVFVNNISEIFLVELDRQIGRSDHIDEKHSYLTPLGPLIMVRRASRLSRSGVIRVLNGWEIGKRRTAPATKTRSRRTFEAAALADQMQPRAAAQTKTRYFWIRTTATRALHVVTADLPIKISYASLALEACAR